MPDPAIEAAQQAWAERYPNGSVSLAASAYQDGLGVIVIAAAREALKPIRAKYEYLNARFGDGNTEIAVGIRWVLEDLATLIYTTEELAQ